MGYVGRAYDKDKSERTPITIIIDEFAEFAIPEFPSFLNRVRGAGIGVVIAHQSRGDLKAVSDDYMLKIEANTNTVNAFCDVFSKFTYIKRFCHNFNP
jgi:type IV secretory pathway TraG/TraD family ATPase VirD4